MRIIELTQGKVAVVDDCDYDYLNQWKWYYNQGYARRQSSASLLNTSSRQHTVGMHREVMFRMGGEPVHTDHIDGDRLNNTRGNLRASTCSENCRNTGPAKHNKSGLKGVCWKPRISKWVAQICHNRKVRHLGYFNTKEDAAKAYNAASTKYHGNFAYLNEIKA